MRFMILQLLMNSSVPPGIRKPIARRHIALERMWTYEDQAAGQPYSGKTRVLFLSPEEANKKYNLNIGPRVHFSRLAVDRSINESARKALERIGGLPKGKYRVTAFTQFLQSYTGYQREEIHNICKGTVSGYNHQYLAEDFGKKGSGNFAVNGDFFDTTTMVPFEKASLRGEWKMEYDAKGSRGSEVLSQDDLQQEGGSYRRTVTVKWNFEPNDPCLRLAEMIANDLAYAEAYLDKTVRQKAGEQYEKDFEKAIELEKTQDNVKRPDPIEIYKCHVDRYAYERLNGSPPPGDQLNCEDPQQVGGVGDEIGASAGCSVVDEQAYRENAKRSCTPEEGVAGIIAHEKTHTQQCQSDPGNYSSTDPAMWGGFEVAAHLIGINEMLKGLKRLCPNDDTSAFEIRIETINRSRLRK